MSASLKDQKILPNESEGLHEKNQKILPNESKGLNVIIRFLRCGNPVKDPYEETRVSSQGFEESFALAQLVSSDS